MTTALETFIAAVIGGKKVMSDEEARAAWQAAHCDSLPVVDAMRAWMGGADPLPIAAQIASFGQDYRSYRMTWGNRSSRSAPGRMTALFIERDLFIKEFGFAVPSAEAIALLAAAPLLEVGAGSGAWAKLVAQAGGDVVATDPGLQAFPFSLGHYRPVLPLQGKTAVRRWPARNVFCSWPSYDATWLRQAARAMRPGRTLFVVREDATANEETWDYIESAFCCTAQLELITFGSCHDTFEAWVKRPTTSHRPTGYSELG